MSKLFKKDVYVALISILSKDAEILELFENIVELFELISLSRERKKQPEYLEKLKSLGEHITIRWYE